MQIAVTGATGFVGRHVAATLPGRGPRVGALVRRPEPARLLLGPAPELVPGDLADATTLAALVRGSDAVIHLVGIIVEAGPATFDAVHVEGTRRVLAAARAAGDRKSTRLNSSHLVISYAVFCLK